VRLAASEYLNCEEYQVLKTKFSSGVTLKELRSIAVVVSLMSGLLEPSREDKRSYVLMIKWFKDRWETVGPMLPFIHLRDANDRIIDSRRELIDKVMKGHLKGC
jgi:hypothetical protein